MSGGTWTCAVTRLKLKARHSCIVAGCLLLSFVAALTGFGAAKYQSSGSEYSPSQARDELQSAEVALQRNPYAGFWHSQAAIAYEMMGDLVLAENEIRQAIQADPVNPLHQLSLASVIYEKDHRDTDSLIAQLRDTLAADPKNPLIHFVLGSAFMIQGQRDDAQKAFESCIEVMKYTNGGSYLDRLGNYYDVSGLSSEATQRLDDLSHMPSHVENENQKNWSNPKSQQASTPLEKEGEKLLKKAQAALATPKNTWAATWHSRAAIAYVVLENLDAAQKESMEAIQADPANPGIYNFAASIAGRKDAPRQIELLRKSLSLDNANPYTHYKLGEALEAAGNLVEARTEYSICLSLMSRLRNKTYYEDPTHGIHLLEGLQQNARDRKKALDAILATVQSQPKS